MKIENNQPAEIYFLRKNMRTSTQTTTFRQLFFYEGQLSGNSAESSSKLLSFSEITIAPNAQYDFVATDNIRLVLLALVGEVKVINNKQTSLFFSGECRSYLVSNSKTLTLENPSQQRPNSFIAIQIIENPSSDSTFKLQKNAFQNIVLSADKRFKVHIGAFGSRKEGKLAFDGDATAFCFVINGIIEIEGRLTEGGDSLYFFNNKKIEIQSLSENAILLVLEEKLN